MTKHTSVESSEPNNEIAVTDDQQRIQERPRGDVTTAAK